MSECALSDPSLVGSKRPPMKKEATLKRKGLSKRHLMKKEATIKRKGLRKRPPMKKRQPKNATG
jgi:hypothetical protein